MTVVEITREAPAGGDRFSAYGQQAVYNVVDRDAWTGVNHAALHGRIVDLARRVWQASVVIVDATGVGAGLASFLKAELARRGPDGPAIEVAPFTFTSKSKSQMAWDFISLIQGGRFREYVDRAPAGSEAARVTTQFWAQMRSVEYDVARTTGKLMTWGTPPNRGHDDLVISAAMTALLDAYDVQPRIARGS